jgi:L-2-hydroxycarboxylate dehydrogenase (NAD+)
MVDILSGLLSGANWGPFTPPFTLQRHFNLDPKVGTVGKGMGHFVSTCLPLHTHIALSLEH